MGEMSGKVALVTGASRGIGAAIAARFAGAGASVAVTARTVHEGDHRFVGSLDTLVERIRSEGATVLAIPADLSVAADRARVVAEATDQLGPIDVLVNNAAITYYGLVESFSEKRFRLMFEVQVRAPFELAQLVLGGMRERKRGWIVNVSSASSHHPQGPPFDEPRGGGATVYGMCKAALERFTTGLASEVYNDGIAVNVVSPSGLVLTPGVLYHRLDQFTPPERYEAAEVTAEAVYVLANGDPATLTGKVTYARQLLDEVGSER